MSETTPSVEKLEKQLRVLKRKLERSEWHRVDLENQHDRDQHLYRRLQSDLEAAQREAQIQLALERIRTQSSLMQHSSELVATSAVFHEQLLALGVDTEFSYVWLPEEREGKHQFWATWTEEEDGAPVHRSRAITYDLDKSEPYTAACFAAWERDDPIHVDFIAPDDVAHFFATWEELLGGAEHLRPERFPDGLYYAEGYMQYGCFGINIRREPTEEERDILRRFAVEFERAYTRFLDLRRAEAQAREAEIEAALERVRARTMAMRTSEELAEAAGVVFQQLQGLGLVGETDRFGFGVIDEAEAEATIWETEQGGGVISRGFTMPLLGFAPVEATYRTYREAPPEERKQIVIVNEFSGELLSDYVNFLIDHTDFGTDEATRQSRGDLPERWIDHVFGYSHGFLMLGSFRLLGTEAQAILQRFARVFEQTYTRFLDLKQAEAQAREAQIEAALERVRSRAVAMRSSDELGELSFELVNQVQALGVDTWHCAFHIYDEDEERSTEWGANADGYYPTYTIPRVGIFRRYYEIGQSGVDLHVEVIGEDRAAEHYEALCAVPGVGEVLLGLENSGVPFPERQVDHVAYFKYGYLIFITFEPAPDAHDVFRRFARVFEQAYTRFLDLQAAEEQAREAQIEAALERVRSRTMGMQKSEELRDIIRVVRDHIVSLDIHADHAGFIMDYKDRDDMHIWLTDDGDVPSEVVIPYFDSPHWNSFRDAKAQGERAFTNDLGFEDKNAFYEQLFELIPGVPEEAKAFYLGCPGLSISTVLLDNVGLYIENFSGRPYTDEENRTLMRFGKVFQQAYTRYLDLEQAEARAREAQIEAALERVRSRALEMTSSEELLDVVFKIRQEFAGLGLECGAFWHTRYTPESYHKALTGIDGQKLAAVMELPRDFASNPALAAWERGDEKIGVFKFDTEAACEYHHHMVTKGKFFDVDPEAITQEMIREHGGWTFVQARTSHGEIGYSLWGETEPSDEAKDVLVRFTSTFDLAYRRFEDLQQAEADHQALLEEKAMTEQALTELRATQAQLVQQEKLASLGALTAGIAHEIKNPLNFVNNFAALTVELVDELAEEADPEEREAILADLRTNASKIHEHGQRADGIVRGMMAHARGGAGHREAVQLNALVEEYVELAWHGQRARVPGFNAEVVRDYGDDVGTVEVVPQEVGRVLINLLSNAFDAVHERAGQQNGQYAPTVRVASRRVGDEVEVRVGDNGPGMPEAVRAKIFEPFFTTKPTGAGTGLGLSLSHDIVTQGHGGTLEVETAEGEGTTFTFTLPAPSPLPPS